MAVILVYRRQAFGFQSLWRCIVFSLILALVGYAGAKILYILENLKDTLHEGISLGGVSFFGSLWFIPVIMPIFGKLFGFSKKHTLDICAPCVAAMIGFMRIGCTMNGCCGAAPIHWGDTTVILPIQLLEVIADFLLMAYLLRGKPKYTGNGNGYPAMAAGYSTIRFFHEFLRDTPKVGGLFSRGHCWAIITFIIAFSYLVAYDSYATPKQKTK